MKKSLLLASLCAIALTTTACSDVTKAQLTAWGSAHRITLYAADGTVIKTWDTDGKITSASGSDGYEFKDKATGKLVQCSGTVIVETL